MEVHATGQGCVSCRCRNTEQTLTMHAMPSSNGRRRVGRRGLKPREDLIREPSRGTEGLTRRRHHPRHRTGSRSSVSLVWFLGLRILQSRTIRGLGRLFGLWLSSILRYFAGRADPMNLPNYAMPSSFACFLECCSFSALVVVPILMVRSSGARLGRFGFLV
jgi:hypothetical protein